MIGFLQPYRCFQCGHGDSEELDSTWTELHNQAYQIYSQPKVISVRDTTGRHTEHLLANLYNMSLPFSFLFQFCEFVSVSCLAHVVGKVVRMLLDYVSHVSICFKLRQILQRRPEWDEISDILGKTAETSLYIRKMCKTCTLKQRKTWHFEKWFK